MARSNTKKQTTTKKAASKTTPRTANKQGEPAAKAQPGMMSTDIRKDFRKTLLSRFQGKASSPGKRF